MSPCWRAMRDQRDAHHQRPPDADRTVPRRASGDRARSSRSSFRAIGQGAHQFSPSSDPMIRTNASSSVAHPVCCSSSAGVPAATIAPAGHHDDAIAERGNLRHDVAGDQDGAPERGEPADLAGAPPRAHHIEAVGRFVEHAGWPVGAPSRAPAPGAGVRPSTAPPARRAASAARPRWASSARRCRRDRSRRATP